MTENTNTQEQNLEVTQNNEGNTVNQSATTQVETKKGLIYSEEEVNSQMRQTRLATEKQTKKALLASLGLTLEDEDKLDMFKQAYQNSLSEEDKKNAELTTLQNDKANLQAELDEKDYIIKALTALTGKQEDDVSKIVKMRIKTITFGE